MCHGARSAGLPFGTTEQVIAAEDLSERNNLHVIEPTCPRDYRVYDRSQDSLPHSPRREPLIPVRFAVAAYRFGHSQVRPNYRLNFGAAPGSEFFGFLFDDSADPNDPDPKDTRGGKRAPCRFVDWQTFFKFDNDNFRPNKKIDTKLSTPLFLLPGSRGPAPGLPSDGIQR